MKGAGPIRDCAASPGAQHPFVLLAALAGFWADRHLFYLFPVMILLAGHVLNNASAGARRRMGFSLASICAVHVFMYGHWRFVKGADPGYTASHQVEYMSERRCLRAALKTLSAGAAVAMLLLSSDAGPGLSQSEELI